MKQRATDGIDGPGVVRANVVVACVLVIIAAIGFAWPRPNPIPASASVSAAVVAVVALFDAVVMPTSSLTRLQR